MLALAGTLCGGASGEAGRYFWAEQGKVKAMLSRRPSLQWYRVFYKISPRPSVAAHPKRRRYCPYFSRANKAAR
jgi:hypothetical protein